MLQMYLVLMLEPLKDEAFKSGSRELESKLGWLDSDSCNLFVRLCQSQRISLIADLI